MKSDIIAAISTPPGEGGIAIIRVSGNGSLPLAEKIFLPAQPGRKIKERPSFSLTLGWIVNQHGEKIDEVLVSIMRGPNSYTGEDVIEINCHGGTLPARRVLERVLNSGARLAEPGEFTRRAFLNGRLDASQAEAVIEVIRAKSDKALNLAIKQLNGHNRMYFDRLEQQIIKVNAMIEASLDFPDEVGEPDYEEIQQILQEGLQDIERILRAGKRAEIYREGIKAVICGKPNVGKSSLLNRLVRKEKAIVTHIPGTTRDIIEDFVNIKGIPVRIADTAGIRQAGDLVEKIGVERAQQVIREADLALFLLDVGTGITAEDLEVYRNLDKKKVIILVNKEDLREKHISEQELMNLFPEVKIVRVSVMEDRGIEELEEAIESMVLSGLLDTDDLEMMVNIRHQEALLRCKQHLEDTRRVLKDIPLDCLGVDMWGALESIGEISGKNIKEEVIDQIFIDFCIGK